MAFGGTREVSYFWNPDLLIYTLLCSTNINTCEVKLMVNIHNDFKNVRTGNVYIRTNMKIFFWQSNQKGRLVKTFVFIEDNE